MNALSVRRAQDRKHSKAWNSGCCTITYFSLTVAAWTWIVAATVQVPVMCSPRRQVRHSLLLIKIVKKYLVGMSFLLLFFWGGGFSISLVKKKKERIYKFRVQIHEKTAGEAPPVSSFPFHTLTGIAADAWALQYHSHHYFIFNNSILFVFLTNCLITFVRVCDSFCRLCGTQYACLKAGGAGDQREFDIAAKH